ncbi:MAG: hypothetical protein V1881_01365 [Candidatus Micrarchaeota archaeon]
MAGIRAKSGLRAKYVVNRLQTAENIVKTLIRNHPDTKKFPESGPWNRSNLFFSSILRVTGIRRVFSKKKTFGYNDPDSVTANAGAFEVTDPTGIIAIVEIGRLGKPVIHVKKGQLEFGKEIANEFKIHAGYGNLPAIKVHSALVPIDRRYGKHGVLLQRQSEEYQEVRH